MALLQSDSLMLKRGAKISDEEFRDLAKYIYELLGIEIPEKRRYLLENRLGTRLDALSLKSFSEYLAYLHHDPGNVAEMDQLINQITTNETSFYRDMVQLENFRDKVLKPLLAKRMASGTKTLRIWSAGCSSGEEPYTLAILACEMLKAGLGQWNIRITASDVSTAILNQAQKGVYAKYAFRTTPPEMLQRYFIEDGPRFEVRPEVKKLVKFEQVNLNDAAAMKRVARSDVIFCRNVIIYFDDEMKRRLAAAFYDNLVPDGYLLLGHSESLHNISRTFVPVPDMGSPVYCKGGGRS